MMTPDPLPPDLLHLERELTARPRREPPAELRSRILADASRERPTPRPELAGGGFLRFAAATAAAALLAINLSASVANGAGWGLPLPGGGSDVAVVAGHLRALDPDVSDRDALRQALLLQTAAGLTPAPSPAASADRISWHKDPDRWDMP